MGDLIKLDFETLGDPWDYHYDNMPFEQTPPSFHSNDFPTDDGCGKGTLDISSAEHWYSLRRCSRCASFYTEAENQDPSSHCQYHSGEFLEGSLARRGWTCCSSSVAHGPTAYLNPRHPGCKQQPKHREDSAFTNVMKHFPFDPNGNRSEQLKLALEDSEIRKKTPLPIEEDPNYFAHRVTHADTLAGLALRYKTTKETLKRVNRLFNDIVGQREYIWVPKSPDVQGPTPSDEPRTQKAHLRDAFAKRTGCAPEEAAYYLEECNWDAAAAYKNWQDDMSWANRQTKRK